MTVRELVTKLIKGNFVGSTSSWTDNAEELFEGMQRSSLDQREILLILDTGPRNQAQEARACCSNG